MTRAPDPHTEIAYRTVGAAGASRTVLVLRGGALAMTDPDPVVTRRFPVRLLLIDLDGEETDDPPAFGGETPAGSTAAGILHLMDEIAPTGSVGVVAERDAVPFAVALAADLGGRIDRLTLVAAAPPDSALARDVAAERLERVVADVQLICADPDPASVAWFGDHLAHCDVVDASDRAHGGRLALTAVWLDALAHVASGSR